MLKQVVHFEDYNGESSTETLYFNLTKAELMGMLDFADRLKKWYDQVQGEPRDLTTAEAVELLSMVKFLVEKSYGQRSEDGKRFLKNRAIYEDFTQTACYDAWLMGLFEQPDKVFEFITGVMPGDLVTKALKEMKAQDEQIPNFLKSNEVVELPQPKVFDVTPKRFNDYTERELLEMTQEEFQKLVPAKPKDMTRDQLAIAYQRKMLQSQE